MPERRDSGRQCTGDNIRAQEGNTPDQQLFGTDWPGPGVPDIKKNLDEFLALPLSQELQLQILSKTALTIWPG